MMFKTPSLFSAWWPTHTLRRAARGLYLSAWLCLAITPLQAQTPSTFPIVIGHALLCLNQMDAGYFYSYLSKIFGKPYKLEGGAWWFRTETTLWGVPISEIMVSDGEGAQTFIGAVADVSPDRLAAAITTAMGIRHAQLDKGSFPVRESPAGSTIVFFGQKSKVYCAKSQILLPGPRS